MAIRATFHGTVIAQSDDKVVVEGSHVPPDPKGATKEIKDGMAFWQGVVVG